ncbi:MULTISPECIES: ureidoglycolate lyase [Marivita]|uniref:Ureidoglycolate lyase n=1 Tax=Marivita cryptomonadis TaxID=505252 RepID=A0A9Q2P0B9_9RHOB|nr:MULTISPECIES: ureidoglycolate lyase [Marivita]MCR9170006.1 ureidoglycolate lyase [Paracoccaceae bacterium]MBM2323327.1 ureidoglycolate lyase [Marivita cryptomonadis]MBM2332913.1 ureidoglycolate lyase [Marivita cryptomonadis]MBM2342494.1 ureidoglycolate lyase [Marivita cryptomonadis]MBM2347161.1 ureidoglycolate lyase [Marivita cryptomonadis]
MTRQILTEPMTATAFAPFGDLLDCAGDPDKLINQGLCGRYHDRASLDFADGRAGISLFKAELRSLPYTLDLMERHPLGSQAFVPMSHDPFLVIVAPDAGGAPGAPRAFLTQGGQAINIHRNTWHGVLTPLAGTGLFAVIDRIGDGVNLEEHWLDEPWTVS